MTGSKWTIRSAKVEARPNEATVISVKFLAGSTISEACRDMWQLSVATNRRVVGIFNDSLVIADAPAAIADSESEWRKKLYGD